MSPVTRRVVAMVPVTGAPTRAYADPLLAEFMRPVHDGATAHWARAQIVGTDGLRLMLEPSDVVLRSPALAPPVTVDQRRAFAILCARAVHRSPTFDAWSTAWLSGADRSRRGSLAAAITGPRPASDPAYVAHWAMLACGASDVDAPSWAAQTAALVASLVCPSGTFDYTQRAEAALEIA